MPNCNLITLLHTESRRNVRSKILMTFLVSGVFGDKVKIFAANDEGAMHFGGDDGASENTAADGDFASEGTFLV